MKPIILSFIISFGAITASAQSIEHSVIGSAGSEQKKSSIVLSSTVGEPAIQTLKKSSLIITQGFQQTLDVITDTSDGGGDTTSIIESSRIISMSLYPNPTHSSVNFVFNSNERFILNVFDAGGKLIKTTEFKDQEGAEQSVQVQNWENGVYHFRFNDTKMKTTSFQVVKQ